MRWTNTGHRGAAEMVAVAAMWPAIGGVVGRGSRPALEGASVSYLVSGREWRERRIRKSLQQSCHLHRAAADLYSLCRPLPLARSPPGAPNRVPGASSAAPATKNPPKVDNGRCDPISFWVLSSAQVTVRTNLQPGHMIDSKKTDRRIICAGWLRAAADGGLSQRTCSRGAPTPTRVAAAA